ncbi:MAG: hypothetical protein WCO26_18790 [Deltaproteobacteria bacterium]
MMTNKRERVFLALALIPLILTTPGYCGDGEASRQSLKGLKELMVAVEKLQPDLEKLGMTRSQIEGDVKSKLTSAGIRIISNVQELAKTPGRPLLYVIVNSYHRPDIGIVAFSINVELSQSVSLKRSQNLDMVCSYLVRGLHRTNRR